VASIFCEHRRVKTTCPSCKPMPAEAPARPKPVALPSGTAPSPLPQEARDEDEAPSSMAASGPGKPLLPTRKRARKASAQDMANADAWFVRRG
jgi:hypothetical protein